MKFERKLTDTLAREALKLLKPGEFGWCPVRTGFGMRAKSNGKGTWQGQERDQRGATLRDSFGAIGVVPCEAAWEDVRKWQEQIQRGIDPRKIAPPSADLTLLELIEQYLPVAEEEQKPRSFRETTRHLMVNWVPLHRHSVQELEGNPRLVSDQLAKIAKPTKADSTVRRPTALRAKSAISDCFRWAIGAHIAKSNPTVGLNQPAVVVVRDRRPTDNELRDILRACDDGSEYSTIVKLLALTGTRRQEVGGMRWSELDLGPRRLWKIPRARSKNGAEHWVPLSDQAMAIIARVPLRSVDTLFGQSADGFTAWSVSRERLEERITKLRGEPLAPPWRLHDLRRSISSTLVEQYEIEPHIAAALLGHAIGSKVDRGYIYARYEAPLRRALSVWGRHIEELLTDADRKVLPLSREAS